MSKIRARVPTLPTPTTLRAAWTSVNCSSRCRRSDCSVRRYLPSTVRISSYSASARTSVKSSSRGTIIGGSLMIRRRPSTRVVSLPSAFVLSRVWALASSFSAALNLFAFIWDRNLPMACSMSRCAYQTSRNGCPAKPRIAVRYAPAAARTILRRALAGNPLSRPATARLAASRLTSHSNGPGRVSSKSLTSKTRRRSGDANAPKFDRCASPHSCTRSPEAGVPARSAAIGSAAPR